MKSYRKLLRDILNNGTAHADRTGVGTTSIFGYQWRHNLQDGFPLLTTKLVRLEKVAYELLWFLSGSTDVKDLQANDVHIWDEWATKEQCGKFGRPEGDLGHVYGGLWRNFFNMNVDQYLDRERGFAHANRRVPGNDQIRTLLEDITNSPNSRRLIVSGWHPYEQKQVTLPPCHTLWQMKCDVATREISLSLYARSIDAFLGLPFNIASYALLLTMIGHVTDYSPKDLIISFGDLHIYNNHLDQVQEQLSRDPYPLPSVTIHSPVVEGGPLANLLAIKREHIKLHDYEHHPAIKAPVAV
jgi:thymidylate synthase